MTALVAPGPHWFETWLECVRDFGEEFRQGSGESMGDGFGPDRRSFDALLEVIRIQSDPATVQPDRLVPCDYVWVMHQTTMIGFLASGLVCVVQPTKPEPRRIRIQHQRAFLA